MKKFFYIIILSAIFWLMPSTLFADGVVLGTVSLNGETITAEYYIHGNTASLGSGHNACISQYSVGIVDVPASITVNNVTYPVTAVSDLAFRMCSRIKVVKFSVGVTRIGNFAFVGCQALTKIDLPSTVTTIGTGAFINLPYLQRIDIHATTPPTWEYNDVFCFHLGGISDNQIYHNSETMLCVPEGSSDIYRNANFTNPEIGWTTPDGWGYFTNINIAADENAEEYTVYNGGTLTFYYDGNKGIREGTKYQLNTGEHFPGWTDPTNGNQPTSSPDPDNHAGDITRVVFAPSFYNARPVSTCKWFLDCVNLDTIIGWEYLNTSEVKEMSFMFEGCTKLTSDDLDFSDFETSKVEGMMSMFQGCTGLTELDLDMFETRQCENMGYMFKGCSNLFYINLSSFRTDNCEYFDGMFENCSNLEELNIASFNMQRLVSTDLMFKNCAKLKDLFIPVSINQASSAFSGCTSMENVYCYRFEPFDSWVYADIAFAPDKATMFHVLESTYNAWVAKYGEGGSYFTVANVTFVGDLGTDASPILLYSPADWTNLQNLLNRDVPVNAKMMNDIEVETMLGVSTDPNTNTLAIKPFTGLFDGNGYTLTVNYNIEDNNSVMFPAPFRCVTNAYIMNLHVNGTMTASATEGCQYPGGLVGAVINNGASSLSTIITNCHVSTEMNGRFSGSGGILGLINSDESVSIKGCLFDGKINPDHNIYLNEDSYAALITMRASNSLSVSDCLAMGFSDNGNINKYFFCSALFEPYNNIVNSYVRSSLADSYQQHSYQNQDLYARSITSGTQGLGLDFGTIKEDYYTSGITAYNSGLKVGETFYAGFDQYIPITLVAPGYNYDINLIQPENPINAVDDTHITAHVAFENIVITLPLTFTTIILHDSDDNYDNSVVLSNYEDNGEYYYDVQFQGLTLNARGKWNPFCLPFDLSETEVFNSPLGHAKLKVLDTITFDKKVLVYHFKDTTAITADKPYLIMLDEDQAIESPTFSHVTIKRSQPSGMKVELEGNPHKGFICIGNYEYINYRYESDPDNVTTFYLNHYNELDELIEVNSSTTFRAFDVRFQLAGISEADVNAIVLDIEDGTSDQEDDIFYTNVPYDVLFYKDGNWNEEDNWTKHDPWDGLPSYNVYIVADATIPSGCEAEVDQLTVAEEASLTIADGGQLKHNNEGVTATVQKHIDPYNGDGGYYLLTNPTLDGQDPEDLGMTANNYDLYWFNQSEELEWRNYKQVPFNLANGIGYLYANNESTDINFTGVLNPAGTDISVPLTYDANASFSGFNLVGNPFVCNAYLADGRDFYILDDVGAEVILSTTNNNSIAPMQGVFVQAATDESELAFCTTEPTPGRALNLSLTRNDGSRGASIIDKARIRFGEGRVMEKFQLNPNHSKLYIPQDGKDYAVVIANKAGELPLNFKAEENGTYTLSFSNEAVEFNYLHLVDNLTGADVDLLALRQAQGPATYTFTAKQTDYESRFKLVFSTICGDAEGDNDFAFINNGNIIVNGEGTLQVIDMTGHVIASTDVARNVSTSGMTPGVYVLRLIYGDDVKTQKMIIK